MDTKKPSAPESSNLVETASAPSVVKQTTVSQPKDVGKPPLSSSSSSSPERSEGEARVITSDLDSPLPGVGRKPMVTLDMTKPVGEVLDIDKDTVVYLIFLLYKTNMIARNNLRNMIDQISKPLPDNVLKWLVNEAAKVGR